MTLTFTTLAEGLDHPEAVAWDPRGWFYAGGEAGQLYRISLDGEVEQVASTGGFLLGIAVDGDGRVYACDNVRGEVVVIDPATGVVDVFTSGSAARRLRTPNYLAFAADGTLYVTDSGEWKADDGAVFRVEPGGTTEVWSEAVPRFPNGCCLSTSGNELLVVESLGPSVSAIPIGGDGGAGEATLVMELPGTVPDGVAVDESGAVYVSCYRPDVIYRQPPGGTPEVVAEDTQGTVLGAPTNIAFGGDDLRTLVVANLGRWHLSMASAQVAGASLHYPSL